MVVKKKAKRKVAPRKQVRKTVAKSARKKKGRWSLYHFFKDKSAEEK